MKTQCEKMTRVLLAILAGIAMAGVVQAETVIKDQFGLKERVVGLPLNKTATESGDANWQATPNVIMAGEGDAGYVAIADVMPFMARVSIPPTAKLITVEAKLRAVPSKVSGNWMAIGIGNPKLGSPPWGNGVFVTIDTAGNYGCLGDPDPNDFVSKSVVGIKRGKMPEFNPDGLNRVKLEFDKADNSVSVWINGSPVMEKVSIGGKNFTVEPAFAGFSGFGQEPKSKTVTDFTVTYSQ